MLQGCTSYEFNYLKLKLIEILFVLHNQKSESRWLLALAQWLQEVRGDVLVILLT